MKLSLEHYPYNNQKYLEKNISQISPSGNRTRNLSLGLAVRIAKLPMLSNYSVTSIEVIAI